MTNETKDGLLVDTAEKPDPFHVAVDLETLGLGFHAPVVALALVLFTEEEILGSQFFRLEWEDQPNRVVARETLEWWVEQEPEILRNSLGDQPRVATFTALAHLWPVLANATTVWGNPPAFDLGLLKALYQSMGSGVVPWSHRAERCGRTIRLHHDRVDAERPHDPVSDAEALARQVQLAAQTVGGIW